jgi:splicing factor 3B subunit 1
LLEDALMDRDMIHRQTAATTVKHLALGVVGLGCEDVLVHLLNLVWPNIFEESAHVISAAMEAVEALIVGLGVGRVMQYTIQGLFHPARKVREMFWKVYNSLLIYSVDAAVAFQPLLPDDMRNSFGVAHNTVIF